MKKKVIQRVEKGERNTEDGGRRKVYRGFKKEKVTDER